MRGEDGRLRGKKKEGKRKRKDFAVLQKYEMVCNGRHVGKL